MSIGDMPGFPEELRPRGVKLINLLKENEICGREVLINMFSALGTLTVDNSGISVNGIFGSFHIDSSGLKALGESIDLMVNFTVSLIKRRLSMLINRERDDRQLFVRVGEKAVKIVIKPLSLKRVPVSINEVTATRLPVIELCPTEYKESGAKPLLDLFEWYVNKSDFPVLSEYFRLRIHRTEDLLDWLDCGWDRVAEMLCMVVPVVHLTRKESLDGLSECYADFWDELLKKCGV